MAHSTHGVDQSRRKLLTGAAGLLSGAAANQALASAPPRPQDFGVSPRHTYTHGQGSMMYNAGHDMQGAVTEPLGAPADDAVEYREFDLRFELIQHELLPGVTMPAFAFNGQVPGPVFRVQENDWIKVNVWNNTEEMHTIHWHGVDLIYTMDGVPRVNQDPIRQAFPYTREYVLVLEAFDVNFTRKHINELLTGMKKVNKMMQRGTLTPLTHGFIKRYADFFSAVKNGWRPPYTRGNAEVNNIKPTFFAINGKSFPATVGEHGHLKIKTGEYIRIRLINGGIEDHHMHLHGHQFWQVAEDGNPLPQPVRLNTVPVTPGKTVDIIVYGDNPGFWDFHDHKELHTRNNGIYPGGMITMLEYEDMGPVPYVPSLSINQ